MKLIVNARFLTHKITGVQRFALEIAREIKKQKPETIFLCPKNITLEKEAIELDAIKVGKFTSHIWEQIELPIHLILNYENPILLNLCNTAPLFYKYNYITIHDLAFFHNPKWFSFGFRTFYKFLIPKISNSSKLIFTVSQFSKTELMKYFKIREDKIIVLGNYISNTFKDLIVENNNKKNKKKYILSVCSLDPRKNLSLLIEAFSKSNLNDLDLVLVGEKNKNFNKFNYNISNKSEKIKFTGYINEKELFEYYKNADLFVYPSVYEGFGIPPLESLYCNCPVLISDLEVFKEIFKNEVTYFKSNSLADLISNLNKYEFKVGNFNNLNLKKWEYFASIIIKKINHE